MVRSCNASERCSPRRDRPVPSWSGGDSPRYGGAKWKPPRTAWTFCTPDAAIACYHRVYHTAVPAGRHDHQPASLSSKLRLLDRKVTLHRPCTENECRLLLHHAARESYSRGAAESDDSRHSLSLLWDFTSPLTIPHQR